MQGSDFSTNKLSYKIFIDRYAAKDLTKTKFKVGDIVLIIVDAAKGNRELGNVFEINGQDVTVNLADTDKKITVNIEQLDVPLELNPEQMHKRVAYALAEGAEEHDMCWIRRFCDMIETGDNQTVIDNRFSDIVDTFFENQCNWKFVPGGRILSGAGVDAELSFFNCFVIPCPKDSRKGINDNIGLMTEIMARGGGVGVNLSSLRPKGAYVKSVNGRSSGAVSWGDDYSSRVARVEQGGSRRGACLLALNDWHPDIVEFITAKKTPGRLTMCNMSVGISDAFMQAVKEDSDWNLEFPDTRVPNYTDTWDGNINKWKKDGHPVLVHKTVKARDIWSLIIKSAWANGEPGLLFLDKANSLSNSNYYPEGHIIAANPCVTGDTLIAVADGRRSVPIQQLAEEGKDVPVYCVDDNGNTCVRMGRNPRKTGIKVRILQLILDDGSSVRLTPNHKCLLRWGGTKEAQDLKPGDTLMSFDDKFYLPLKEQQDALRIMYDRKVVSRIPHIISKDVYNLTVDDFHNYAIVTNTKAGICSGIFVMNCGEQMLSANDSCLLGHINLSKFSDDVKKQDYTDLERTVRLAVRFLDSVYDISTFITEEIQKQALGARRMGLGTLGLADLLIRLGIIYGANKKCIKLIEDIYSRIAIYAYLESIEIAKERGAFPYCNKEIHSKLPFIQLLDKQARKLGICEDLSYQIQQHGIRNVCLLTQAPTGTTGTMLNTSTGIEPFPMIEGWTRQGRIGNYNDSIAVVKEYMEANPYCKELPSYFVASMGERAISSNDHLETMVAIQKWTDASISKTNNMAADATVEDVAKFYMALYDKGAKGGTVFRDGCRGEQVLSSIKEKEVDKKVVKENMMTKMYRRADDEEVSTSLKVKVMTPGGHLHVTLVITDGSPSELFLVVGKAGSEIAANCEAIGRLCSSYLQVSSDVTPIERLRQLQDHLRHIGGNGQSGIGPKKVRSLPDGVGKAIEIFLKQLDGGKEEVEEKTIPVEEVDKEVLKKVKKVRKNKSLDLCPLCGSFSLVHESSCERCLTCSYSKC